MVPLSTARPTAFRADWPLPPAALYSSAHHLPTASGARTELAVTNLVPKPGFTRDQYRMLAALYVYVSARAGRWLIPAQHNTVDSTIPDAHDDPQNFDLQAFGKELEKLIGKPKG